MLGAIFARIVRNFAKIFRDFVQIFKDFARIFDKSKLLGVRLHPRLLHYWLHNTISQWFLTGRRAPTGGRQEISTGARALTCSTTWKVSERKCVHFKRSASANFTPLHVIWFSSGRDGSRG